MKQNLFSFDILLLLTTLRKKALFIIFFSVSLAFFAGVSSKLFIDNKWKVRTILMRYQKNMSLQTDMPYLYQEIDMRTVLETIKLRRNLNAVIKKLNLNTVPEKLFNKIEIERGRKSNILHILVTDENVHRAVSIANTLADTFITSFVPIKNSSAKKIHIYYLKQRTELVKKIELAEEEAVKFKNKKNLISIESETSIKFDQLKDLEIERMKTEMDIEDITTTIKNNRKNIDILPDEIITRTTIKQSDVIVLQELQAELTQLSQKYTDKNPKIVKLNVAIKQQKKKIARGKGVRGLATQLTYGKNDIRQTLLVENMKLNSMLKAGKQKIKVYKIKIDAIKQSLKDLSKAQREFFSISRKSETYKELLKMVNSRIMEVKLAKESNISDFSVLEQAAVPRYPLSARRKVIVIVVFILAFLMALMAVLAKELADYSIKSSIDFTQKLTLPCVGNIPRQHEVSAEIFYSQFQIFFNKINDMMSVESTPTIIFSSDVRGSGKSFLIDETVQFLIAERKRVLTIQVCYDDEVESLSETHVPSINNLLFNHESSPPLLETEKVTYLHHRTWLHVDAALVTMPLNKDSFAHINKDGMFDIVLWELFPFKMNIQLATNIMASATHTFIVGQFRHSQVIGINKVLHFIDEESDMPISGVINDIEKAYLQLHF